MVISASTQSALQRAAQSTGLAKKVFTQGNNGISSAQLIMEFQQALKLAGINLTVPETVTLGAVQIALAGGAVASDFENGVKTLQCVGDISIGVSGIVEVLSALGLVSGTVADFVGLATNLALVFASGGANVLADIGAVISLIQCAVDVGPALFGSQSEADQQAKANLSKAINSVISPQIQNVSALLHLYAQGGINLFDMIGQIALNDPTQFATAFPGLAIIFPSWIQTTYTGKGESDGWFSDKTSSDSETIISLVTNKQQVQDILVQTYFETPLRNFDSFNTVAPIISLKALSVLSLILNSGGGGDVEVGFDFNAVGAMVALGITPSILGDDWLFKGLQRNENGVADFASTFPYQPLTMPLIRPIVSSQEINGYAAFTADQILQNQKANELIELQLLMQKLDADGDIASLVKIPEACAILKEYNKIVFTPTFYSQQNLDSDQRNFDSQRNALGAEYNALYFQANEALTVKQIWNEIVALDVYNPAQASWKKVGEITNMTLTGKSITSQSWYNWQMNTDPSTDSGKMFWNYVYGNYAIDMSDYWRCLQTLQRMQTSQLLQDDTEISDFNTSINELTDLYNNAYGFVIAKNLNIKARQNIAQILGIPVDKLTARYDSAGNLIFYQKGE